MVCSHRGALRLGVALGALTLGCPAFAGGALGQTASAATELQPVLQLAPIPVTGAAVEEQPAWTDSTDRQELDRRFVRSWEDLGRRVDAGVNFNRQNDSINIRGLDGDRVLTTIDGIRLPYLDDGARQVRGGLRSFDFDSLSQIDIVRGADSSRYGSGALGGVLALRTFDPEDLLADGRDFGGIGKFGYQGDDDSVGGTTAVAGRVGDTYLMLQAGLRYGHELDNRGNVGGYGADRTKNNPDDYDQQSLLVKLAHHFEGGHRLSFTGEYFRRQDNLDIKTDQGPGESYLIGHDDGIERSERKRASLGYDYVAPEPGGLLDRAHLTLYWQQSERTDENSGLRSTDARAFIIPGDPFQYGYPSGRYTRNNRIEETLWGLNGEAEKTVELATLPNRLTVGGEYYHLGIEQHSGGADNCPATPTTRPAIFGPRLCSFLHTNQADMPEVNGNTVGLYAEDEIALFEDRVKVTPGLRFDWYELTPQETAAYRDNPNAAGGLPNSSSDSALSPKVMVSWQAVEEVTFYAQWAKGFKAPTAYQLYLNYGGPGTYLSLGNPDLKPETSSGYEIGARLGDDDLGGSLTFFDTWYNNFIDTLSVDPASVGVPSGSYPLGVTSYQNRARVRIYGVEAAAHWRFGDGWRSWASLAWSVGRDEGAETYLNSVPPLRAILGLGYDAASWGADASVTMATRRDKVEDPDLQFKAPGYAVFDMTGWWEPEGANGLRVQAGLFNLFDTKYYDALNVPDAPTQPLRYYTEPGRSVRLNLTYKF
ncbi:MULTISPECIES: TonB-dependent hemoglobin/transferrin/lactoferrin family receptor [unclassified Inquilinus]|uniref:TonB-dependent hemoglobin/transferrin/lactoferrin family receptor n=1 Tax=unclassified Inquilinus TaxID=2645927 RepID=UPI003F8FD874